MSLELHHLHLSQSERIVWLLEELRIQYDLHVYERDPQTAMAPAELKSLNPFGTAPYFQDTTVSPPVKLSESGAIVEYLLAVYGQSSPAGAMLVRKPGDQDYGPYLQWLHFANASLQPSLSLNMVFSLAGASKENPIISTFRSRTSRALQKLDDRLKTTKYLAGEELSAADIMTVFSLTTHRGFTGEVDLDPFKNILRYLKDVAERPAYKRAISKGDHDMEPLIGAKVKKFTQFAVFAKTEPEH
ncbi:glutathione S-transferase [Coniella lustricola]|uniref:Glutathione S-transferase n=1 Tax=Coniella lustricola TaxID=2025994 RepID=A0A2T3A265_9PEZI|nr:glutathione S-transferase [Coniella lustricola]